MLSTPALLIINMHLKIIFVIWSINILHWCISTANNNTVCKQVCGVYSAKHPRFQIHSYFYHVTTTITVNVEYKLIRRKQCFSNDMQNTCIVSLSVIAIYMIKILDKNQTCCGVLPGISFATPSQFLFSDSLNSGEFIRVLSIKSTAKFCDIVNVGLKPG